MCINRSDKLYKKNELDLSSFANVDERFIVQTAKFGRTLTLTFMSMLMFGRTLTLSKLPRGPQKRTKTMSNMILIPKNERRQTLANIGQIYSKIPKNTPKIPQNAPKTSKTNVKNVKNEEKLSKFGRTLTLTMLPGPAQKQTLTLSMLPGPAQKRTQTMSKKHSNFLDELRQRQRSP